MLLNACSACSLNDFKSSTHTGLDYVKNSGTNILCLSPLRRSVWSTRLYHGGERTPQNTKIMLLRQQKFHRTVQDWMLTFIVSFSSRYMDDPRGTLLKKLLLGPALKTEKRHVRGFSMSGTLRSFLKSFHRFLKVHCCISKLKCDIIFFTNWSIYLYSPCWFTYLYSGRDRAPSSYKWSFVICIIINLALHVPARLCHIAIKMENCQAFGAKPSTNIIFKTSCHNRLMSVENTLKYSMIQSLKRRA